MEQKVKSVVTLYSRRTGLIALLLTLIFVGITLGLGNYSNLVIPGNPDPSARYLAEPSTHLDFMSEWDGPHYLSIAQHGYSNRALTAFFPLYPLLIRLLMFVISSPLISALVVSWLALAVALYFYLKILAQLFRDADVSTKIMGVLLFLFFPTGVFLAATYTESLFACLALAAIYFALNKRYLVAGLMAGLATATHPEGVFITALIGLLLLEARLNWGKVIAAVTIGISGIVGYIIYLSYSFNKPLAFVSAQRHNHWLSGNPFAQIVNSATPIDLILFLIVIAAVIYWWKRRLSFALYSLLFVLLPLIGGNFAGYSRYSLMAFPVQFMLFAKTRKNTLAYASVLVLSGILWAYFVIHYAAGYTGGS